MLIKIDDYLEDEDEQEGDPARALSAEVLEQERVGYRIGGWSDLPKDILESIADRLLFLPDLKRFASVCVAWRSVSLTKHHLLVHQPPILMVSYEEDTLSCNFFCLSDMEFHKLHLPELHQRWCCGSSNGWLITLGDDLRLTLLNPFSRVQIQLPPHPLLEGQYVKTDMSGLCKDGLIHKVIISDNPTTNPGCIVMALVSDTSKFSFCRLADDTWTVLETAPCLDATYFEGQFYASVDHDGVVHNIDMGHDVHDNDQLTQMTNVPFGRLGRKIRYFVESSRYLLHVIKYWEVISYEDEEQQQQQNVEFNGDEDVSNDNTNDNGGGDGEGNSSGDGEVALVLDSRPYYKTVAFQVFKLNEGNQGPEREWTELKSLGHQALFIGGGHSLSLSLSDTPSCKANCIYFMDDIGDCLETIPMCSDMGIFNMMDGSIEPFPVAPGWSTLPFWITQNL